MNNSTLKEIIANDIEENSWILGNKIWISKLISKISNKWIAILVILGFLWKRTLWLHFAPQKLEAQKAIKNIAKLGT